MADGKFTNLLNTWKKEIDQESEYDYAEFTENLKKLLCPSQKTVLEKLLKNNRITSITEIDISNREYSFEQAFDANEVSITFTYEPRNKTK